jgi:glutamate synthase (NADPH/NADH) large chain
VEGVGDHGCEYMTGGTVVVLGSTGRNFAAGMSGGIAYVYDILGQFRENCNMEMVDLDPIGDDDMETLKSLLSEHVATTGSAVAKFILSDLDNQIKQFIKVYPRDYKKVMEMKKAGKTAIIK